jgi:Tfp pilus assembly protein PilF
MAADVEEVERRIIPRWRRFRASLAMGELGTARKGPAGEPHDVAATRALEEKLSDWRAEGGLSFASDALGTALVLGRGGDVRDVAHFILDLGGKATASARTLAQAVLAGRTERIEVASEVRGIQRDELRQEVASLREMLNEGPRNAIAWTNLAHAHTLLGNLEHAERAMRTALALAGENRFVLRSGARFLLHIGEPEEAHRVLKSATATATDPWLLAAEIAVASATNGRPRFAKTGAAILNQGARSAFETTELASALATLELTAGNIRGARKLFRSAVRAPTENSVAQAEWASRQNIGFGLSERTLETPGSYEARAFEARAAGHWETALDEARRWFYDQPFSRHASSFASYLAGVPLERYAECADLARGGLIATPRDPLLLNNLAFALASSGQVAEAEEHFAEIPASALGGPMAVTLLATQGLLEYRRGNVEQGRARYLRAIDMAREEGDSFKVALASLYLAREATLANDARAREFCELALSESVRRKEPEIGQLRKRQRERLGSRGAHD